MTKFLTDQEGLTHVGSVTASNFYRFVVKVASQTLTTGSTISYFIIVYLSNMLYEEGEFSVVENMGR